MAKSGDVDRFGKVRRAGRKFLAVEREIESLRNGVKQRVLYRGQSFAFALPVDHRIDNRAHPQLGQFPRRLIGQPSQYSGEGMHPLSCRQGVPGRNHARGQRHRRPGNSRFLRSRARREEKVVRHQNVVFGSQFANRPESVVHHRGHADFHECLEGVESEIPGRNNVRMFENILLLQVGADRDVVESEPQEFRLPLVDTDHGDFVSAPTQRAAQRQKRVEVTG